MHSKRIPKFSKTFPGIFTVPFRFGPEISVFLVEWKAPKVHLKIRSNFRSVLLDFQSFTVFESPFAHPDVITFQNLKLKIHQSFFPHQG